MGPLNPGTFSNGCLGQDPILRTIWCGPNMLMDILDGTKFQGLFAMGQIFHGCFGQDWCPARPWSIRGACRPPSVPHIASSKLQSVQAATPVGGKFLFVLYLFLAHPFRISTVCTCFMVFIMC